MGLQKRNLIPFMSQGLKLLEVHFSVVKYVYQHKTEVYCTALVIIGNGVRSTNGSYKHEITYILRVLWSYSLKCINLFKKECISVSEFRYGLLVQNLYSCITELLVQHL